MKEKFTLYELLITGDIVNNKKVKIYSKTTSSFVGEYLINDIPFHLLKKEIYCAFYYENVIEVLVR